MSSSLSIFRSFSLLFLALIFFNLEINRVSTAEIEEDGDNIDERGDVDQFFQGDIKLEPSSRSGIIGSNYRWPGKTLIYQLAPGFSSTELSLIRSAMAEISEKTCIRFKTRSSETAYVYIQRTNTGCWSNVGRIGRKQTLNLQPRGCMRKGIIAHELIHSLGYFHEQMRADRDDYVRINWSNIQPRAVGNFNKFQAKDVKTFGVPYDYGSLMHYSAFAFAIDSRTPTIITKKTGVAIGQRNALSSGDVQKLRKMYSC